MFLGVGTQGPRQRHVGGESPQEHRDAGRAAEPHLVLVLRQDQTGASGLMRAAVPQR